LSDSVSEMELSEKEIADKIDFGAIFDETESAGEVNDIHLTEVLGFQSEDSISQSNDTVESLIDDDSQPSEESAVDEDLAEQDSTIRLADDQYGMEEPFDPSEIERPHDYNWFIREMKNEIKEKTAEKKLNSEPKTGKFPKKPDSEYTVDDMDTTGQFSISEIDADNSMGPQTKTSAVDELDKMLTKASQKNKPKASLKGNSTRLSLAEKLLVQELARRLAERIISQIPREKLQSILDEVFDDLKKC